MSRIEINRSEIYKIVDGVSVLQEVIETEVEVHTDEEVIAEKESQLLAIYEEIQALKQK